MSLQTWQETLVSNQTVGATIAATTITSLLPTDSVFTIPANYMQIGKKLRITAHGQTTTVVTTPGTKTFTVNFGGVAAFVTPAMPLNIVAGTYSWRLEIIMTCFAVGSGTTAAMRSIATFTSQAVIGSPTAGTGSQGTLISPLGAPVNGTGWSSVAAQAIDLLITNTVASGEILHSYLLESLN